MFDERELSLFAGCIFRELEFLRAVEACGIPTVLQQSQLMMLRAKVLEKSQKGDGDVTEWLEWFLGCYIRAVAGSNKLIAGVLAKADFWKKHPAAQISDRQRKVVNRLLDAGRGEFEGGLTTRKYVSIAKVSRATAFREISDLLEKGFLNQNTAGGRSSNYDLRWG